MDATIMIIEDESIIAKDIECILKNYGYNIAGPFSRAEEAINALDEIKPDLILMDIVLKGDLDGIEAADIIRKKISVPIIYLTAYADDVTINRIKSAEPYGYFLKPFEEKELYTWIETTLYKFSKEEKLKKDISYYKSILKCIDKSVFAIDKNGIIKFVNNEAEKLTGFNENEIIGCPILNFIKIKNNLNNFSDVAVKEIPFDNTLQQNLNNAYLKCNNEVIKIDCMVSPITFDGINNGYFFTFSEIANGNEKELINELKVKLESSKKELQQFAYVSSHDLQEPLRMIASYVQLLQKRYQDKIDASADEFIAFAVEGVNRMKTLLNDLLSYSRLNTIPTVFALTDLNVVLKQTLNSLKNQFPEKSININCKNLPAINADSSQIKQLFHNLLNNAIKFNNNKTAIINITSDLNNGYYEFKISDNGIGMDSQYYTRIFEVFQRLHNYSEYPGTGIGLAICKKIAENHNGNIKVESIPDKGSTFIIKLSSNG